MRKNLRIVAILAASLTATEALAAAGDVCLQHNRLQSWRAVDASTLVMTDLQQNRYTVRLNGRCANLTQAAAVLSYRTWQNLACLRSGDIITVAAPGLGAVTCSVAGVQAGAPGGPPP